MTRFRCLTFLFALSIFSVSAVPAVADDPGLAPIGEVGFWLHFATNDDPSAAGGLAKRLTADKIADLQKHKDLKFKHYRLLGTDRKPVLRAYENWATPLKPSKEILVSFEPRKRVDDDRLQLNLEYWQGNRKILTTDPTLTKGKSLYLLGPEWRKGRLILEMKILSLGANKAS